jgi:hypothetical protein
MRYFRRGVKSVNRRFMETKAGKIEELGSIAACLTLTVDAQRLLFRTFEK